jgi:2-polyprenyl-3-methyl-5-hydroxy-6-metoxy-1,4-benzoquinol methylase
LAAEQLIARDRVLEHYQTGTYTVEPAACVCGHSDGVAVVELDRYGLPAPSRLCRARGIVWSTPQLTDRALARFYETDYRALYSGAATDTFLRHQISRGVKTRQYVSSFLDDRARVADVGCGAGGLLLPFREAGHNVIGCDLDETYLEHGRREGLDLRRGTYEALADLAPFDLVLLSHVVEHIAALPQFLAGVRSLLARDGLAYIELPGLRRISSSYGDPLRYFQNAHLWNFDLAALSRTLTRSGLRLVEGNEYIRAVFTPAAEDSAARSGSSYEQNLRALARAERRRVPATLYLRTRRYAPTQARIRSGLRRLRSRP